MSIYLVVFVEKIRKELVTIPAQLHTAPRLKAKPTYICMRLEKFTNTSQFLTERESMVGLTQAVSTDL